LVGVAVVFAVVNSLQQPRTAPISRASRLHAFSDLATHLIALDVEAFKSSHLIALELPDVEAIKSSVTDNLDAAVAAKTSALDAIEATKSSAEAAKDTVLAPLKSAQESLDATKTSVEAAKDSAVGTVLAPIKSAQESLDAAKSSALDAKDSAVAQALAPIKSAQDTIGASLPDIPLPDIPLPKGAALPKVSLPAFGGGDPGDGPFAAAQATLRTAGIGAAVGGVVGARLGWAARGWAQAASSKKDGVSGALGKAKDAVSGKA
jgi:hypothetical protein